MAEVVVIEIRTTSREAVIQITKEAVIIITSQGVAKIASAGVGIIITNADHSKATKNWTVLTVGKRATMQGIVGQRMVSKLDKQIRKTGIFKIPIFELPAKCRIS